MKNRLVLTVIAVLLTLALALPAAAAVNNSQVKLTPQQQQQLAPLYDQLFRTRGQIIDKYQEFKVIDPDKAAKMKTRLEDRQKNLKENGYLPKWQYKKAKCPRFNDKDND